MSKFKNKSCNGNVLFQVLLGLGLMVMMAPLVFTQIKKYNEGIQREEVITHMETFQKAVTSFVTFEKDTKKGSSLLIPDKTAGSQFPKIKLWKGEEMKTVLSDYLGNPIPPTSNAFGQEYSFITARNGDMIEALVVASGGGVDELVLNGIGQYLFDKGAVLASDGVLLSDLSLSQTLLNEAKKMVSPTLGGALLMFVNDAFFSSDFLHISEMPGDSERSVLFNTMIVDLNMNMNNILNVKNLYTTKMNVNLSSFISSLSTKNVTVDGDITVNNFVEFQNKEGISHSSANTLPFKTPIVKVANFLTNSTTNDTELSYVDMADVVLNTSELVAKEYNVLGDVNVDNGWTSMQIDNMNANILSSMNGTKEDNITNIVMKVSNGDNQSFIYVGSYNVNTEKYIQDESLRLNLSGVSEIQDVCIVSSSSQTCLSDRVKYVYNLLNEKLASALDILGRK